MSDNNNEKLFTQEEVNAIIKKRLEKVKSQKTPDEDEREKAFKERESDLLKKELTLSCREYLLNENLPADLLEVVKGESLEDFQTKITALKSMNVGIKSAPYGEVEPVITGDRDKNDPFKNIGAMKHKPKNLSKTPCYIERI